MNKLYASCIAVVLAAATFSVSAADMSSQEQSELRTRAERLQAEKQRNPSWDGGRMSGDSRDMRSSRTRDDVKAPAAKKTKAKKTTAKKAKAKKGKGNVQRTSGKTKDKPQRAQ